MADDPINNRTVIALQTEARRAIEKHGDRWLGNPENLFDRETLAALVEEVGEVARELTYDNGGDLGRLIAEAVQVGHLGLAIAQAATDLHGRCPTDGRNCPPGCGH